MYIAGALAGVGVSIGTPTPALIACHVSRVVSCRVVCCVCRVASGCGWCWCWPS
jgi:hypothetical protein